MEKGKYPIIANGELYVEPISKKMNFPPKEWPHDYNDAKINICNDLNNIKKKIEDKEEIFLDEKVLCIRLEPKLEAKSYVPDSLMISEDMQIIGGRKYAFVDENGEKKDAKLYFVKAKNAGIDKLEKTLRNGSKDTVEKWRRQIQSIKNIDLLSSEEKVQGLTEDWTKGTIEIVLHPLENSVQKMIDAFMEISGLSSNEIKIKSYEKGLTFISAVCDREIIAAIEKFNPLRSLHPMGDIDLEPMRMVQEVEGPRPAKKKMRSNITVGMFDGGIIEDHVLLKGYAKENDVVNTTATSNSLQHGNSVCGAILHGHLGGKTPSDELKNPSVFVESFRVLPAETQITSTRDAESVHGMYETIDQIEAVVAERKDIKLYNLSFGPKEPILDDNISRFTYALDRLTYNVEEGEINPLFCTAVGNDGNRGEYLNRIQTPSDGRYVETLIREYLKRYLPKDLEVLTGFILRPAVKTGLKNRSRKNEVDSHSTQLDILIYDSAKYPIFQRFGENVIVPPEGVAGIISVKKNLHENDIVHEAQALKAASKLCRCVDDNGQHLRGPFLALVSMDAFEKKEKTTEQWIFEKLEGVYSKEDDYFDDLIGYIGSFNKWSIFKRRPQDGEVGEYIFFNHSEEEAHMGFQFLLTGILSVYYDKTRNYISRPGFTAFPSHRACDKKLGDIEVRAIR